MREHTTSDSLKTQPRPSSFVSLLSGWVQQAMESFFATQRILIDVAMRQNASTMKAMRESFTDPEHSPASILTELAVEGTSNFIEAQRILLDLAQEENDILMSGLKDRVGGSNTATAMTNLMRRSVDNFVAMQQEFLTIASKQTHGWLHDTKAGKPYDRNRLIDLAREGMENFVHTQKKLLDVIAEETTRVSSGKKDERSRPAKKTEIAALARDSANAMISAQKKLLDVAAQQMKVNLQSATKATDVAMPFRLPIAKLTGEGVQSFVDAEKALIDSMMKSRQAKPGETLHERPMRTVRVKRTKVKAARRPKVAAKAKTAAA